MSKNTVEITLIASQKVGMLPALMRKLGTLGLIYRRCNTKDFDDGVKFTLICAGELDCDKSFLIKSIKEVPNVDSIINITQREAQADEFFDSVEDNMDEFTELHILRATDAITHDVMQIVEDRLAEAFGPVANLLLKSAAKKSSCVGDLFSILSKDLTEHQKLYFLKNVEGLDNTLADKNLVDKTLVNNTLVS